VRLSMEQRVQALTRWSRLLGLRNVSVSVGTRVLGGWWPDPRIEPGASYSPQRGRREGPLARAQGAGTASWGWAVGRRGRRAGGRRELAGRTRTTALRAERGARRPRRVGQLEAGARRSRLGGSRRSQVQGARSDAGPAVRDDRGGARRRRSAIFRAVQERKRRQWLPAEQQRRSGGALRRDVIGRRLMAVRGRGWEPKAEAGRLESRGDTGEPVWAVERLTGAADAVPGAPGIAPSDRPVGVPGARALRRGRIAGLTRAWSGPVVGTGPVVQGALSVSGRSDGGLDRPGVRSMTQRDVRSEIEAALSRFGQRLAYEQRVGGAR